MKKREILEIAGKYGIKLKGTRADAEKQLAGILERAEMAISHHKKMSNCFFYSPPENASNRRYYEKRNSMIVEIGIAQYVANVECSCRNIYYKGAFYFDGQKKNVRLFKTIVADLETALGDYFTVKEMTRRLTGKGE